jgi:hypothetical protein
MSVTRTIKNRSESGCPNVFGETTAGVLTRHHLSCSDENIIAEESLMLRGVLITYYWG